MPSARYKSGLQSSMSLGLMNLHEFFLNCAHVEKRFFETTFSTQIDNKHAFENSFNFEGVNIVFSNWHHEFSLNKGNQWDYYNTCYGFNSKD
jgi:hypothetical protein